VTPHVLLIFIATSDAGTPTSEALLRALNEALGSGSRVTLQGSPSPPTDQAMAERARSGHATAAVRLVWDDPDRTRVAMRVYLAKGDEGHDQRLRFQPTDPAEERGRALGFVIASYLLPPLARPAPPAIVARPPPSEPARWALEGFGSAAVAMDGEGSGVGGGFGLRYRVGERWGVRAGMHLRTGSVPQAQASSFSGAASAGLFRVLASDAGPHGLALVTRVEALLVYDSLTHFSQDDVVPVRQGRFLPAASALVELEWRLATVAALHLAAGVEQAFGKTRVYVQDVQTTDLGRLRGVAEAGFRTRF
jgi:hypothetical protein